ncbi:enoyl-CoA hydratase [Modicisalibacter muralis]|uniref:Enoyl-CoA hydratase n=1 Tax=Modicisalibacter muralis TaxID=119000 RepID=A0A1G9LM30_9GAMM|nr:enoyl-CoA hydratase-related protein [Halomonas muralis]SDL62936.1 enoyl-CoA hydratase [Halomonas muralis]
MRERQDIKVEGPEVGVLCLRLNRPEVRNALRTQTLRELADLLEAAAADNAVRAVLLLGDKRAFAAGADVREMAELDPVGVWQHERPRQWERIARFPKPLLAAVNGYCLGGGCELAMHADIILAGEGACFGQPEIRLGMIPGAGGTQRLIRIVGKALASQMVLSGEPIDAATARERGLVAEVVEAEQVEPRALELARSIAERPLLAVLAAKELLQQSFETSLSVGLEAERRSFALLAASDDRNEGIAAFLEKRRPNFHGR